MNHEILEQAADWVDRQGELTSEEQDRFASWLTKPEHLAAYERISRAMAATELNEALLTTQQSHPAEQSFLSSVVTLDEVKAATYNNKLNDKHHTKLTSATWLSLAAGIMCFCLILAGYLSSEPSSAPTQVVSVSPPPTSQTDYIAGIGSRQSKLLTDGTLVHLNANSDLLISQQPKERHAVLNQGQVYFNVAHDKKRPFTIDAGLANILVVGTEFDVDRLSDRLIVTVYEGHVRVHAEQSYDLHKGQQFTLIAGHQAELSTVQLSMLPEWRNGWLDVSQEPLATVLEKVQRYVHQPIILDPSISPKMMINGRFALDRPHQTLRLLAKANDLVLEEKDRHLLLRSL